MFIDAAPADETRFLRLKDVLARVPVSRATLYRAMDRGEFPKTVRLGSCSMWVAGEVDEWVKRAVADR
jgi:prophage regulatory protein